MKKIKPFIIIIFFALNIFAPYVLLNASAQEGDGNGVNNTLKSNIITIVNESTNLFTPIASTTEENYMPSSRKWNGMPSVIKAGQNIFIAWQTGGVREPDPDHYNYVTVAASTDGGVTWKDPFMIIDPLEEQKQTGVPMFYYNHSGQLYLLFSYEGVGIHAVGIHNAEGSLDGITYDAPFYIGSGNSSFTKPTLLSDGSIVYASGTVDTKIFSSKNDGKSFNQIAVTESETSSSFRRFSESVIVEKNDGLLWHLRRLENAANGGIEQGFSADGGKTWTVAQGNLPEPLRSPGSRFAMQRLSSGALLFVTNAAGMGGINRTKMTAYLSEDDGDSWPYSILLDPLMSSYPDFYQSEDGEIYITFDKDRYGEGGIRLCVVTEQDIKAGAFVSDKARQLLVVTKMNYNFADIKSVNGAFPKTAYFKKGMSLESILSNYSTVISVTDDKGVTHQLTGRYRISGYKDSVAGEYKAYFITDLPETLKDSFSLLEFKIITQEKSGCAGDAAIGGGCAAIFGAAGIFAIGKKNRRKQL